MSYFTILVGFLVGRTVSSLFALPISISCLYLLAPARHSLLFFFIFLVLFPSLQKTSSMRSSLIAVVGAAATVSASDPAAVTRVAECHIEPIGSLLRSFFLCGVVLSCLILSCVVLSCCVVCRVLYCLDFCLV